MVLGGAPPWGGRALCILPAMKDDLPRRQMSGDPGDKWGPPGHCSPTAEGQSQKWGWGREGNPERWRDH